MQPQNIPIEFETPGGPFEFGTTIGGPGESPREQLESKSYVKARLRDIESDLTQVMTKVKIL